MGCWAQNFTLYQELHPSIQPSRTTAIPHLRGERSSRSHSSASFLLYLSAEMVVWKREPGRHQLCCFAGVLVIYHVTLPLLITSDSGVGEKAGENLRSQGPGQSLLAQALNSGRGGNFFVVPKLGTYTQLFPHPSVLSAKTRGGGRGRLSGWIAPQLLWWQARLGTQSDFILESKLLSGGSWPTTGHFHCPPQRGHYFFHFWALRGNEQVDFLNCLSITADQEARLSTTGQRKSPRAHSYTFLYLFLLWWNDHTFLPCFLCHLENLGTSLSWLLAVGVSDALWNPRDSA